MYVLPPGHFRDAPAEECAAGRDAGGGGERAAHAAAAGGNSSQTCL